MESEMSEHFLAAKHGTMVNLRHVQYINTSGEASVADGTEFALRSDWEDDLDDCGVVPAAAGAMAAIAWEHEGAGVVIHVPIVAWRIDRLIGGIPVFPRQLSDTDDMGIVGIVTTGGILYDGVICSEDEFRAAAVKEKAA